MLREQDLIDRSLLGYQFRDQFKLLQLKHTRRKSKNMNQGACHQDFVSTSLSQMLLGLIDYQQCILEMAQVHAHIFFADVKIEFNSSIAGHSIDYFKEKVEAAEMMV